MLIRARTGISCVFSDFPTSFRSAFIELALLLLIVSLPFSAVASTGHSLGDQFIGVDDIRPGDRGYGKTVFKGTAVEEFDVEVLGLTRQGTSLTPYIIVRVSGPEVEEAGGIVDGMSGSPVYIDNRLAGALSHVYSGSPYVGLVTPISAMLRLMSYGSTSGDRFLKSQEVEPAQENDAVQLQSTLLVSGISGRSLELARASLAGCNRVAVASGASDSPPDNQAIEPGSAIAVQLVDGDIEVSIAGTVTYVDGDDFVAFGHHFEAGGAVDYIASRAQVICIMQSKEGPFKLAAPLDPIGRITQDRFTGLAGKLGSSAETVDVSVRVHDQETGENGVYRFSVINDERFVHSLVTAGVLQAFDSTLGRIGAGTSRVSMTLKLSGRPNVERVNTYSDWSDIALWSLSEISEAIAMVVTNEYAPVQVTGLVVEAEFSPDVRTARIEAVEVDTDEVSPGDALTVRVTLRPYRAQAHVEEVQIDIPVDASPGYAQLTVQGGSEAFGAVLYDPQSGDVYGTDVWDQYVSEFASYPDLGSQLAEFSSRPKSTDLILDLYLPEQSDADSSNGPSEEEPGVREHTSPDAAVMVQADDDNGLRNEEAGDRAPAPAQQPRYRESAADSTIRIVIPTPYVVYGYQDLGITIGDTGGASESDGLDGIG